MAKIWKIVQNMCGIDIVPDNDVENENRILYQENQQ
jgi:hypothetical protein